MDKRKEHAFAREIERLRRRNALPSLSEVCEAVLESRRTFANKIRRSRRESAEQRKTVIN